MDYKELEQWIKSVDQRLDNHLIHTAGEISQIRNDIDWIKRFFWLMAGISVTGIGGMVFGVIFK